MKDALLPAGRYAVDEPALAFSLGCDIVIGQRNAYVLTGDNGSGKSTFLERVVIPALGRRRALRLFFGSDSENARSAIAVSLGLRRVFRKPGLFDTDLAGLEPITRLVVTLLREMRGANALVLDEYPGDGTALASFARTLAPTALMVTHDLDQCLREIRPFFESVFQLEFSKLGREVGITCTAP